MVLHHHLLKEEISLRVDEGVEGTPPAKMHPDGLEPLIQAADDVEDEGAVGDDLAEGREIVSHLLQAAAVVGDGEVALDEVAEPRLKLDGAYLPVPKELGLNSELGVPGSAALGGDDLGEVVGEGAEDLGLDDAIHPIPILGGNRGAEVDMILEGELADGQ